ncbi:hypothetical protein GDO81_020206 [Engystomops pustulosus]|uniref:Uncharacterized protein n=1 Tax=Engystomops pustulosus TaxID=76066 RepID=A0AAV6YY37_ENGPU|nr:hypothetical protein GDO81_020206 [Engystomops pustulosus]
MKHKFWGRTQYISDLHLHNGILPSISEVLGPEPLLCYDGTLDITLSCTVMKHILVVVVGGLWCRQDESH